LQIIDAGKHQTSIDMQITHPLKRTVLLICLILGPLFQLVDDALWSTNQFAFSWSVWRKASYIFFVPAGILIAKIIEPKSMKWAITCCASL
jgi:predicted membrane chloride channel (bestrophin family)